MIPPCERKLLINSNDDLSITKQCELLQINRTGLYYTPSLESDENLAIMRLLDEFYMDMTGMDQFFGTLKYTKELREKIINETQLG